MVFNYLTQDDGQLVRKLLDIYLYPSLKSLVRPDGLEVHAYWQFLAGSSVAFSQSQLDAPPFVFDCCLGKLGAIWNWRRSGM